MKHTSPAQQSDLLEPFASAFHIEKQIRIKTKREKVKNLAFTATLVLLCTFTLGFINVIENRTAQSEVVK